MSIQDTIKSIAYKVPDGYVDAPYCYLYDASALTDGATYNNLSVVTDWDSDFILRRVVGMNSVLNPNGTGTIQIYDKSRLQFFQQAIKPGLLPSGAVSASWPVMPEKLYPASSQIGFDLTGVLRQFTAASPNIYTGVLGFWGVRRFQKGAFYVHNTPYAFHELPYTYTYGLAVNWGYYTLNDGSGIVNNTRKFGVQILETDFELCAIGVTYADGTPVTANDFQISIYDPSGSRKLSSGPVNLQYMNWNAPAQYGAPVFPVPSIVYPTKGFINFEITSLLPAGTNKSYLLHFMGVWRARN